MAAELVLSVQGQLLSCCADNATDVFCKFSFNAGPEWSIISGCEDGITQASRVDMDHSCVWNYPIDVVFKSPKPFGWPQLICAVYGVNTFGNETVVGYGAFHLPTTSGHACFNVPMFSRAPTTKERWVSWFSGRMPEAIAFNFIAGSGSRETMKTESQGFLKVSFDVVISGLKKLDLTVE
jgi:B9 domain-containing protein 1